MGDRNSLQEGSVFVSIWRGSLRAVAHAEESWVGRHLQMLSNAPAGAVGTSSLAAITTQIGQWVRCSFLHRWLTAEPDPDVIVIDLRETYTVGPILTLLDSILAPLGTAWQGASVEAVVTSLEEQLRRHPVRIVSLVAVVALVTELITALVFATPAQPGVGVRLLFTGIALAGIRLQISWEQCTNSVVYRYLVAALEPPEPPGENTENTRK